LEGREPSLVDINVIKEPKVSLQAGYGELLKSPVRRIEQRFDLISFGAAVLGICGTAVETNSVAFWIAIAPIVIGAARGIAFDPGAADAAGVQRIAATASGFNFARLLLAHPVAAILAFLTASPRRAAAAALAFLPLRAVLAATAASTAGHQQFQARRDLLILELGSLAVSLLVNFAFMPFILAQNESRRGPPSGCGGLRVPPVSRLYAARPLAFRPPSGSWPSLRVQAGDRSRRILSPSLSTELAPLLGVWVVLVAGLGGLLAPLALGVDVVPQATLQLADVVLTAHVSLGLDRFLVGRWPRAQM
jgi:hypothetical protein